MDNIKDTGQEEQDFFDTMDDMESDDLNLAGSQLPNVDGGSVAPIEENKQSDDDDENYTVVNGRKRRKAVTKANTTIVNGDSDNPNVNVQYDIIVIKPVIVNADEFFSKPRLRLEALRLHYRDSEVVKITPNHDKKHVVVTLKKLSPERLRYLCSVKSLGNWEVECRVPYMVSVNPGVISGVHPSLDVDYFANGLRELNFSFKKIIRMNKMVDGQQKPLDCLRVDFTCEIPKSICLDFQIYRVRPFVQGPTRCFKCQNFGHISSKCKSFAKCTKCSGPHSVDQCTSSTLKCANCQGNHSNNFKKCPRFLVAKDIE